ncbi:hypothetical protein NCS52_01248600 [Fusarium sp. LHS14.1]|nr:hypothetical protein NCS52_01248600 [Fusarium sp. LHS14.1]
MAEIAGLVLGVVGVIQPLTSASLFLCDLYQSSNQFGADANAFRVRISVASRQIKMFEDVLLAEKRFNWFSASLFQELEPSLQQDLYGILQELKRCFFLFVEIGKPYGIDYNRQESSTHASVASTAQVVNGDERIRGMHRNVSWAKKIVWSVKDKKNLDELVKDIEHWTGLLRLTIQAILSTSAAFQEFDHLDALGNLDNQAEELRLTLSIRRILLSKPSNISDPAPQLSLRDIQMLPIRDRVSLGVIRTTNTETDVLVERKLFTARDPAEDEKRLARSKQLATLLQKATDPTFRVLRALGYSYDPVEPCATLVYEIPGHLLARPLTLQQLYGLKLLEPRPALEYRFRLALAITESLFSLHSFGWVHKNFMSSNVLLFPLKSQCQIPWQEAGRCSMERIFNHSEIRVVGFELARPEAEQSSLTDLGSSLDNLYRPPARWGPPTETWTAVHDLYALGAVLLEVGLWQKLETLDHRASLNDPLQVEKLLRLHATQRLPYAVGSKYAAIVTGLLNRHFEASVLEQFSPLQVSGDPDSATSRVWILRELNRISSCI